MTQKERGENEEISLDPSMIPEADEKSKLLFSTIIGKHTKQGAKSVSPTMMSGIISDAFCCFGTDLAVKFNSLHDLMKNIGDRISECESVNSVNEKKISDAITNVSNLSEKVDRFIVTINEKLDTHKRESDSKIKNLEELQLHHIIQDNIRQQRSRSWTARINEYLDLRKNQGPNTVQKVFNHVIRPTLLLAKDKGRLKFVPDEMSNICENAHPLGSKDGRPPAFLFKFFSRPVLHAFLAYKKDIIDQINLENQRISPTYAQACEQGEVRPMRAGLDLTSMNRDLMTFLIQQPEVKTAKISGTRVVFNLVSDEKTWRTASNPFGHTWREIQGSPTNVFKWINETANNPPFIQFPHYFNGQPNPKRRVMSDEVNAANNSNSDTLNGYSNREASVIRPTTPRSPPIEPEQDDKPAGCAVETAVCSPVGRSQIQRGSLVGNQLKAASSFVNKEITNASSEIESIKEAVSSMAAETAAVGLDLADGVGKLGAVLSVLVDEPPPCSKPQETTREPEVTKDTDHDESEDEYSSPNKN